MRTLCTPRNGKETSTRCSLARSTANVKVPGLDVHVHGADVDTFGRSIRDCSVLGGQPGADGIVATHDLGTIDLAQVTIEPGHDAVERAVVVEVIGVDVEEDRAVQGQLEMRPVALVGFDDEPLAAGPLGAGAHVGDVTPDHEARP